MEKSSSQSETPPSQTDVTSFNLTTYLVLPFTLVVSSPSLFHGHTRDRSGVWGRLIEFFLGGLYADDIGDVDSDSTSLEDAVL